MQRFWRIAPFTLYQTIRNFGGKINKIRNECIFCRLFSYSKMTFTLARTQQNSISLSIQTKTNGNYLVCWYACVFCEWYKKVLRMIQIKKQRISQYDRNSMISHWNLWKKASNTDIEYKKRMWLDFLLIGHLQWTCVCIWKNCQFHFSCQYMLFFYGITFISLSFTGYNAKLANKWFIWFEYVDVKM